MSTTTNIALITVSGTLGGALLALIGTLITQHIAGLREDRRRQQELDLKTMELAESRFERRREERLNTYRRLGSRYDVVRIYLDKNFVGKVVQETAPTRMPELLEDLTNAMAEVELLAGPEVREAAGNLSGIAAQHIVSLIEGIPDSAIDYGSYVVYEEAFYKAAREELASKEFGLNENGTRLPG